MNFYDAYLGHEADDKKAKNFATFSRETSQREKPFVCASNFGTSSFSKLPAPAL